MQDKLVLMTRNGGIQAIHNNASTIINSTQLNLNGSSIILT